TRRGGMNAIAKVMSKAGASNRRFVMTDHDAMASAAWLVIVKTGAVPLLLEISRRCNGRNNGEISYSQREAEERFGCSSHTAVQWFRVLQEAGFIVLVRKGSFNQKAGVGRASIWRLTMEPCEGKEPTRDYLNFVAPEG